MLSIAPGLRVKDGSGARLGFRDVLRICIGLVGTDMSGAVPNGEWAGNAAGFDTEAMLGNDGSTALVL
jgi:hypothetical protein